MKNRFLGIALVVLTALGMLNLYQAVRGHVGGPHAFAEAPIPPIPPIPDWVPEAPVTFASFTRGEGEVMIDREFSVSAGGLLLIDVQHSDLLIETGDYGKARVVVTLDSPNMGRARDRFEQMKYRAGKDGNQISVRSEMPRSINWRTRMNIKVRVQIPEEFNLDLESTHGDVQLGNLDGDVSLSTTHGDVETQNIRGERIHLKSTHGDVEAGAFSARVVEITTTHGDIEMGTVECERFSAKTTHSDIEIAQVSGDAEVRTTHGDVMLGLVKEHALDVRTTHGDVALKMPGGFGADVELRGERVRMPDSMSLDGNVSKKSIVGQLNGGGPHVEVSTTHGSVTVHSI